MSKSSDLEINYSIQQECSLLCFQLVKAEKMQEPCEKWEPNKTTTREMLA